MKIQDLQQPYRALAEMRREQNSNNYFATTFGFDWELTPEKNKWWHKVWSGGEPEIPAESLAELKEWQKETIKVRITKAEFDTFWYADQVGSVYEVKNTGDDRGYELLINGEKNWIGYKDCEIVPKEEWEVPNYEATVIAEQPKEETLFVRLLQSQSHVWHYSKVGQIFEVVPFDENCYLVIGVNPKEHGFNEPLFISHSHCKVLAHGEKPNEPDPRLFTAAVAAMQGLIIANESSGIIAEHAWDYAQDLINEGKKRGHL